MREGGRHGRTAANTAWAAEPLRGRLAGGSGLKVASVPSAWQPVFVLFGG